MVSRLAFLSAILSAAVLSSALPCGCDDDSTAPGASDSPAPGTSNPPPPGASGSSNVNQCNVGNVQCCDTVQPASQPSTASLLGLLGIVLQDVNIPIGLTCTSVDVLGLATSPKCTAQTVCCENNNFSGLVALGCTPINIGL